MSSRSRSLALSVCITHSLALRSFFGISKASSARSWRMPIDWIMGLERSWLVTWGHYLKRTENYGGAIACWRVAYKGTDVTELEELEAANNTAYHEGVPETVSECSAGAKKPGGCAVREDYPVNWRKDSDISLLLKIFDFRSR